MSTLRTTNIQHGSAGDVNNIVLNASGDVTIASTLLMSSGTAAAPAGTFTGDTNTGFYSPGADQVAISTNATGRLFVDASGNVGIGGTPDGLLSLAGANSDTPRLRIQHPSIDADAGISTYHDGSGSYLILGSNHYINSVGSNAKFLNSTGSAAWYLDGSGNGIFYNSSGSGAISEKLRIDSSGNVGIGTSDPGSYLSGSNQLVVGSASTGAGISIFTPDSSAGSLTFAEGTGAADNARGSIKYFHNATGANGYMQFAVNTAPQMTITTTGVGVGSTSPSNRLTVIDRTTPIALKIGENNDLTTEAGLEIQARNTANTTGYSLQIAVDADEAAATIDFNGSERARIDSSGRLLVGTTSAVGDGYLQVGLRASIFRANSDAFAPSFRLDKKRGSSSVSASDSVGEFLFRGYDGTNFLTAASITSVVDGTPGANDMPGRLMFATTSNGASSPTERMRIHDDGRVSFKREGFSGNPGYNTSGVSINDIASGIILCARSGNTVGWFNRLSNDGTILEFAQDTGIEGSIAVSGSTVSYNGAHLSRWSQLPNNAERIEILRGTVLSNIDEMCEWSYDAEPEILWSKDDELPDGVSVGDVKTPAKDAGVEDNEQLNRMKVSDVEGDRNVAGVFQAWDDDDDTYTNDFYCAMTGDFVVRIGAGVTVERGDLLMSAGDGTAKPQDDDIIRSKTIAKVTSTNVSCTYDDGSYCVPCVLMAC